MQSPPKSGPPPKKWHFHVKSLNIIKGEFSFGTERVVNESDMLELVRRFATQWFNNVTVFPCQQPKCKVGDIGG